MSCQFQTFDDAFDASSTASRMASLRHILKCQGLDGFLVPRADEHQSEYVPPCNERLAWLTGFSGSAGMALILHDQAFLFLDGRYTLQARQSLDLSVLTILASHETPLEEWLDAHGRGLILGYDPLLHRPEQVAKLRQALGQGRLEPIANPIDDLWQDRPSPPRSLIVAYPETLAGESRGARLERVRARLKGEALLISDPHNLAWAFNLRGADVSHTPLALGYGLILPQDKPVLFFDPDRIAPDHLHELDGFAVLAPPSSLHDALKNASQKHPVRLDRETAADVFKTLLEDYRPVLAPDPITALKAVKNATEIAGMRAAHRRDGAAFARFLAWFDNKAPEGLTEIDAVEALEAFRRESGLLKDIAFPTIAGAGPNGAIVHYRVTRGTNRLLKPGEAFLIDSGAQYEDGTTDITRTLVNGKATPDLRRHYTLVLKAHIALSRAIFPIGANGAQLDGLARRPLWEAGLDFDHGTGHGVGCYLSVHEGPQRIAKTGTIVLQEGMILSNEPGYYRADDYGIRIENLVLVQPARIERAERPMLGFETLTLAPYARQLIDLTLLDEDEIIWINAYHQKVRENLTPLLEPETAVWLARATQVLRP